MKYKYLGTTGMRVSELCFGTMTFGDSADRAMSKKMFLKAREAGINFFDCANSYAKGESEKILGELIAGSREELVITSKVYNPAGEGVNNRGGSRKHILRAIGDSLSRLNTDYLDIYFLHQFDPNTPLEETLSVMNDLVRQGRIRYLGVSNFSAWQIAKAQGACERYGWQKIQCVQPMYNLVKRQAEVEILPLAEAESIGIVAYNPLGAGLLSGKYETGATPAQGRLVESERYKKRYAEKWMHECATRFCDFAKKHGHHPVSLAVAWVLAHPAMTAPIIGARNVEQMGPSLESVNLAMTPELYQQIAALSPTPPPATDRTEMME